MAKNNISKKNKVKVHDVTNVTSESKLSPLNDNKINQFGDPLPDDDSKDPDWPNTIEYLKPSNLEASSVLITVSSAPLDGSSLYHTIKLTNVEPAAKAYVTLTYAGKRLFNAPIAPLSSCFILNPIAGAVLPDFEQVIVKFQSISSPL